MRLVDRLSRMSKTSAALEKQALLGAVGKYVGGKIVSNPLVAVPAVAGAAMAPIAGVANYKHTIRGFGL